MDIKSGMKLKATVIAINDGALGQLSFTYI